MFLVTTADERILPQGTAYITDLGMTGAHESVLGRQTDRVLKFMTSGMPAKFELATGDLRMNGIIVEVDSLTGKASSIERTCLCAQADQNEAAYDANNGTSTTFEQDL